MDHSRRRVLRGMFQGAAVTVAIPVLDCFLNTNGTAFASGRPLPVRFGTWFWGLGVTQNRWVPTKTGTDFDLPPELKPIAPYRDKVSILSGFDVLLDGKPNLPHGSGLVGTRTGMVATNPGLPAPTLDVLIADQIGSRSRFRSLELSAIRETSSPLSGRGEGNINPAETSPLAFYERIFGAEFVDPNKSDFKPNPAVKARHSVLSAVAEQRKALEARVGKADREKLDQYFTSLRQTEQQLALQLQQPPAMQACVVPARIQADTAPNNQIENVIESHKVMARLLAMALACDQTRVFTLNFNNPASSLTRAGSTISHHQLTHEEQIDQKLGYQPESTWFVERCMEAFGTFVSILGEFREGDSTLLDNSLVFAHSETNFAKAHTVDSLPLLLAGRAGGKVRSGLHVAGGSSPVTRVGLTLQQVMGVPIDAWGADSMRTRKSVSEILV